MDTCPTVGIGSHVRVAAIASEGILHQAEADIEVKLEG